MFYKRRELRRLWEIEIYTEDPNENPDVPTPTKTETLVAWNAVGAIRATGGRAAKEPKPLYYVTHAEYDGGPIYRIDSTRVGPVGNPVQPSIKPPESEW